MTVFSHLSSPSYFPALHKAWDQILAEHLQDWWHLWRPAPRVHLPTHGVLRVSIRREESILIDAPCSPAPMSWPFKLKNLTDLTLVFRRVEWLRTINGEITLAGLKHFCCQWNVMLIFQAQFNKIECGLSILVQVIKLGKTNRYCQALHGTKH